MWTKNGIRSLVKGKGKNVLSTYSVTCGGQGMDKSVLYRSDASILPIQRLRKDPNEQTLYWMHVKTGAFCDCITTHQLWGTTQKKFLWRLFMTKFKFTNFYGEF